MGRVRSAAGLQELPIPIFMDQLIHKIEILAIRLTGLICLLITLEQIICHKLGK